MLHKIDVCDLEIGMFIESMEGSWLENPFWRSQFILQKPTQLETLIDGGISWVRINDSKGKGLPAATVGRVRNSVQTTIGRSKMQKPTAARSYLPNIHEDRFTKLSPRQRAAEIKKAAGTIKRSRVAVENLFADARLGNAVKSKAMVPLIDKISSSVSVDPTIILNIARIKNKDEYTYLHSVSVCALMINLARKLRIPEDRIEDIGMAGLLHDVGKTSISDEILSKPGKLDESEWKTVRDHPQKGHEILAASEGVGEIALEVCLQHHEKIDGTGYPRKLAGDELSIFTRMSTICDVYDALTSQRPYNKPLSASQALAKMQSWSGHFDKRMLADFADSLGILPIGTLVRLKSDELAIVIGESNSDYASPIVRSFRALDKDGPIEPQYIDTGVQKSSRVLAVEDPEDWGFSDWFNFSAGLLQEPFL